MTPIKIGITQGDINGIGYEVILKALSDSSLFETFAPIIYGSTKALTFHRRTLENCNVNFTPISSASDALAGQISLISCGNTDPKIDVGQSTPDGGNAAFEALLQASTDLQKHLIDAVVTAPIHKAAIQSERFPFSGHTEYFESSFGQHGDSLMLMIAPSLRIAVATTHIPLQKVASILSSDLILKKLHILHHSLIHDFSITSPRIAVLGLNPHAGENGVLGNEEQSIIIPALQQAEVDGLWVSGPFPADGFFGSGAFSHFDAVLAMYHDQGMIPFKLLAMEYGVNYTAGLPIVRTSPAHGTAYDIAGKNLASPTSMREAIYRALDIISSRTMFNSAISHTLN